MAAKDNFPGVWRLVSMETIRTDGQTLYPYGRRAVGRLIYDEAGRMAVQIMNPDRPMFAAADLLKGSAEELKLAFEGYLAYYGTYTVDEAQGTVIHKMEASLFPNWAGQELVRYYELSGNRLTLKAEPFLPAGTKGATLLVWEKEGAPVRQRA